MNSITPSIIVDSSGLISLLMPSDSNHKKAQKALDKYGFISSAIIIPHDILIESLNVLGKKIGHELTIMHAEAILKSDTFSIIDTDKELRLAALLKFKKQTESTSFTDCIVMAIADMWQTQHIFGFDKIFQKNNYITP